MRTYTYHMTVHMTHEVMERTYNNLAEAVDFVEAHVNHVEFEYANVHFFIDNEHVGSQVRFREADWEMLTGGFYARYEQ